MGERQHVDQARLAPRQLGKTDLLLTPIGFGAFKIGRNLGIKYAHGYDLPTDDESERLLRAIVDDLGLNYIDTAPAYGVSEERVGRAMGPRRDVVISTKVGERFEHGKSSFDFSETAVRASIARSRKRLHRETLDLVFVHSSGEDERIQQSTDVISTLQDLKQRGEVRWIGFSGKTMAGAKKALGWADALMVEFNQHDRSQQPVIDEARSMKLGVVVKKPLASGDLPAPEAIGFILNSGVDHMVIGGLNLEHLRSNVEIACAHRPMR
jgi:aryl-alcohol dehydrogenase-like predicted oxidoreductase